MKTSTVLAGTAVAGIAGAFGSIAARMCISPDIEIESHEIDQIEELTLNPEIDDIFNSIVDNWRNNEKRFELDDAIEEFGKLNVLVQGNKDAEDILLIFNGTGEGLDEKAYLFGLVAEQIFGDTKKIITIPAPTQTSKVGMSKRDGFDTIIDGDPIRYARLLYKNLSENTKLGEISAIGHSMGGLMVQAFGVVAKENGQQVDSLISTCPSGMAAQGMDQMLASLYSSSGNQGELLRTGKAGEIFQHLENEKPEAKTALRGIFRTIRNYASQPLTNIGLWRVDARSVLQELIEINLVNGVRATVAYAQGDRVAAPGLQTKSSLSLMKKFPKLYRAFQVEGDHSTLNIPEYFATLLIQMRNEKIIRNNYSLAA